MKLINALSLLLCLVAISPAASANEDAKALAELNERVLRAYVLEHDTAPYAALAHPDYKLIAAPGLIENRDQVLSTPGNLAFNSFEVSTRSVDIVGDTGVVITLIDAKGSVLGQPFPQQLVMMNVYVRQNGDWRLLARSMTPIIVPQEVFDRISGTPAVERP